MGLFHRSDTKLYICESFGGGLSNINENRVKGNGRPKILGLIANIWSHY